MYSHGDSPNKTAFRDSEYFGQIEHFGKHFRTIDKRKNIWREPEYQPNKSLDWDSKESILRRFPLLNKKKGSRYLDSRIGKTTHSSLEASSQPRVLLNKDSKGEKIKLKKLPISNKSISRDLIHKRGKVRKKFFREPKIKSSVINSKTLMKGGKLFYFQFSIQIFQNKTPKILLKSNFTHSRSSPLPPQSQ